MCNSTRETVTLLRIKLGRVISQHREYKLISGIMRFNDSRIVLRRLYKNNGLNDGAL